jgi:large subunit ribosomal protein L9
MKVILRKDHEKLENWRSRRRQRRLAGITSSRGTSRSSRIRQSPLQEEKKQQVDRKAKEQHVAEKVAAELEKLSITLKVKVGEDEKLFGAVTSQMIGEAIQEKGITVDKRSIELEEPIKALGIYTVNVKLHANVAGKVKVWVVRE